MNIYAYNNLNSDIEQLWSYRIDWPMLTRQSGGFGFPEPPIVGQFFSRFFMTPLRTIIDGERKKHLSQYEQNYLARQQLPEDVDANDIVADADALEILAEQSAPGDVVITSSLINFSSNLAGAIRTVGDLDDHGIRVIAIREQFDSFSAEGRKLIDIVPLAKSFQKTAAESRRNRQLSGIKKAADEGRYRGRKAYSVSDFPDFKELYDRYMYREIGKGEFAEKLGVSRPTLDKLLDEFLERG